MSNNRILFGALTAAVILVAGSGALKTQDDDLLVKRVNLLEQRVQKLESILFATSQLSVIEAKQEFDQAKLRLDQSRKLHLRGFLTAAQLESDRFLVQQAERQLDLAKAEGGQREIINQIDMLEAKRNLQVAEENLAHTQQLFDRGYVSERQVQAAEDDLLRFKKQLDLAESKARAAIELLKLGQEKSPGPDAATPDDQPDKQ